MVIKILQALWPFIKEMVLGERSLKQALTNNKKRVAFIVLVFTSIALNIVTLPRLFTIAKQHLALIKDMEKKDKEIEELKKPKEVKKPKVEVIQDSSLPAKVEKSRKRSTQKSSTPGRAETLRQRFDEINRREQDG